MNLSVTQTNLEIVWEATTSDFDFYEIIHSVSGSSDSGLVAKVYPDEERSLDISGLLPDTIYSIEIYAIFNGKRSQPSEALLKTGLSPFRGGGGGGGGAQVC